MSEEAVVAILASCLRLVILTHGRVTGKHVLCQHGILHLLSERLSPLLHELFEGISPSVLAFEFGAGEDGCPFVL